MEPSTEQGPGKSALYRGCAKYYDLAFGGVFGPHIQTTIRSLGLPKGSRVLEVGVGTGLSLACYPDCVEVVGIDLSQEMLRQATQRVQSLGCKHVHLQRMDAMNLIFPDDTFDYVMAFHVLSVVPDVDHVMREMTRVCKPRGKIVIINHFRSQRRWLARLVDLISPLTTYLGWRTDLQVNHLLEAMPVHLEQQSKTSRISLFTELLLSKVTLPREKHVVNGDSDRRRLVGC